MGSRVPRFDARDLGERHTGDVLEDPHRKSLVLDARLLGLPDIFRGEAGLEDSVDFVVGLGLEVSDLVVAVDEKRECRCLDTSDGAKLPDEKVSTSSGSSINARVQKSP